MPSERTITDAAVEASRDGEGRYALCNAIEMDFGVKVTSSSITFTKSGQSVGVETSIDNGQSWHWVNSGDSIPGLKPGASMVDGAVLVRVIFDPRSAVLGAVSSITVTVNFDIGPSVTKTWDSAADFAEGVFFNTATTQFSGILHPVHTISGYIPDAGAHGFYAQTPPLEIGPEQGLQVSRGTRYNRFGPNDARQEDQWAPLNETTEQAEERFRRASWGFEAWVFAKPELSVGLNRRYVMEWETGAGENLLVSPTNRNVGTRVYFEPGASDGSFRLVVATQEFASIAGTSDNVGTRLHELKSADILNFFNRWVHVAFTYDGLNASIIIDGQPRASAVFKRLLGENLGIVYHTDGNFRLGNNREGTRPLGGHISAFRLFKRKPSLGGINSRRLRAPTALVLSQLQEKEGLVASYDFLRSSPSLAVYEDSSSNQYDLTRVGGATWQTLLHHWSGITVPDRLTARLNPIPEGPAPKGPGWQSEPASLETSGNYLRLTTCPFDFVWDGKEFIGVGDYGSVSEIEEDSTVTPVGVAISLSAVDQQIMSIAWQTEILDRPVRIYQVYVDMEETDADLRVVSDPVEVFTGLMDSLVGEQGVRDEETGIVPMSLTLTAYSDLRDWERSRQLRWTDELQRKRHPDDYGLALLDETTRQQVWWPARFTEGRVGPPEE